MYYAVAFVKDDYSATDYRVFPNISGIQTIGNEVLVLFDEGLEVVEEYVLSRVLQIIPFYPSLLEVVEDYCIRMCKGIKVVV